MYQDFAEFGTIKTEYGTYQTMICNDPLTDTYELFIRPKYYGDYKYVVGLDDLKTLEFLSKDIKYLDYWIKEYQIECVMKF